MSVHSISMYNDCIYKREQAEVGASRERERWAGMHLLHREVDPNAAADLPSGGA